MSATIVDLYSPWQRAADAGDRGAELMDDIPAGGDGFELCSESDAELRQAAELMARANKLLRRAKSREAPRYDAWTLTQARWTQPPGT